MVSDIATVPGWYGKLPTLGDFASRRLEADFIEPWDLWLGEGLQSQRDLLGDAWLDAYLQSPPWRFMLLPGVLPGFDPECTLAGVLMPSVDRVGRYFPLTIAATIARLPSSAPDYEALLGWLHRLEDTALDALQDDWTIEQLEEALVGLAPPAAASAEPADHLAPIREALAEALAGEGSFVPIDGVASRAELASIFTGLGGADRPPPSAVRPAHTGRAVWLADNPDRPQLLVSKGLPATEDFIRMFGTSGREPGAETMY
jgi:type VI secretion system protein ImpM